MIIIGKKFSGGDVLDREDSDSGIAGNVDSFKIAIRVTGMVDKSTEICF
jgi:hypothetical protein